MPVKVIDLSQCKDLLGKCDELRALILKGKVQGWAMCFMNHRGEETIFLAGNYERNAEDALQASMNISWEMTKLEDLLIEDDDPIPMLS